MKLLNSMSDGIKFSTAKKEMMMMNLVQLVKLYLNKVKSCLNL
jgi:hypothetical protein